MIVDTATPRVAGGGAGLAVALMGDIVAIGATLMLAKAWRGTLGRQKAREAVKGAGCG
jgi:hypothetical protein